VLVLLQLVGTGATDPAIPKRMAGTRWIGRACRDRAPIVSGRSGFSLFLPMPSNSARLFRLDLRGPHDACFIVKDAIGLAVAYVYYEEEPGRRAAANLMTKEEARRIATNIVKLPGLLG
jgi:hypothetical protein